MGWGEREGREGRKERDARALVQKLTCLGLTGMEAAVDESFCLEFIIMAGAGP